MRKNAINIMAFQGLYTVRAGSSRSTADRQNMLSDHLRSGNGFADFIGTPVDQVSVKVWERCHTFYCAPDRRKISLVINA